MEVLQRTHPGDTDSDSKTRSNMPSTGTTESGTDIMADVQPDEVEFLEMLKESSDHISVVYKVRISDKECIMKVVSEIMQTRAWLHFC